VGNSQKCNKQRVVGRTNNQPTNTEKEKKTMRKSHLIVLSAILIIALTNTVMAADAQPMAAPTASGVVNINTADVAQLALLPRVGTKAAQRIADYRRDHGNFKKASDLMQVKGFGEKSFERLASYVTVDGKTTLSAKVHSARAPKRAKTPTSAAR
jgi:competence protein ComEA